MSDQYEKTKPHKEKMDDDFECRFIVDDKGILDNETGTYFLFIAYDWIDCGIYECCDKLNEQSERIKELEQKLKESCKPLTDDAIRWHYSRLQEREYWKHCQGNRTLTLEKPKNNVRLRG